MAELLAKARDERAFVLAGTVVQMAMETNVEGPIGGSDHPNERTPCRTNIVARCLIHG